MDIFEQLNQLYAQLKDVEIKLITSRIQLNQAILTEQQKMNSELDKLKQAAQKVVTEVEKVKSKKK